VSELLHIRLQDIEPPNNVINILKAKGDKTRWVYKNSETLHALMEYAHEHNRGADEPIFTLTRQQVYNIVRRYGRTIGKEMHPHTLRHSFAINWVRQNQDLRRLQLLLGHSSLAVTQEYLQFRTPTLWTRTTASILLVCSAFCCLVFLAINNARL